MKPVIPPRLRALLEEAGALLPQSMRLESIFDGGEAYSVEDQLRLAISLSETEVQRQALNRILIGVQRICRELQSRLAADAMFVRSTKFYAYLTLLPTPAMGRLIELRDVFAEIDRHEVVRGLDRAAVEAAFRKVAVRHELIWELRVAQGQLPEAGTDARLEFAVRTLDHAALFGDAVGPRRSLRDSLEPVTPYQVLASIRPSEPGRSGVLVSGKKLPAMPGRDLPFHLGVRVRHSEQTGELVATEEGCVVVNGTSVEVVPFLIRDPARGSTWVSPDGRDPAIHFRGSVCVHGPLQGPGSLQARDAYIEGDLVNVDARIERDLYVAGRVVDSRIRAGGRVHAAAAERSSIDALGSLRITEHAAEVRLRSADSISIGSDGRGGLDSGEVEAMNRIVAGRVGRPGGPGTTLSVGSSGLVAELLYELVETDVRLEASLRALAEEKERFLARHGPPPTQSPDHQEAYMQILRREVAEIEARRDSGAALNRLRSLTLPLAPGRIDVLRVFHPPGRVRVGPAHSTIDQPLDAPRFLLGADGALEFRTVRTTARTRKPS